jgi:signal transduction histidine kinase
MTVPHGRKRAGLCIVDSAMGAQRAVLAVSARDRIALSAVADVAAEALSAAPDGGWSAHELRVGASLMCAAVEQIMYETGTAGLIRFPPTLPAERLLGAMRRALLEQVRTGAVSAADAIPLLTAFEKLGGQLDADAAHRFVSRLNGQGGLELLVDVAHDMRSPLGSILFLTEQIRRGYSGPVTVTQDRQLGLLYGAALGLSSMASDVLDLARGGELFVGANPAPFAIPSVFHQVRDLVHPMAEERGLSLLFDTDVTEPRNGHGRAVHRVLLNLVCNAVKFTPSGEVVVTAAACAPSRVQFTVRDSGPGIPEELQATLFDAFRPRAKPGEFAFSSAGLGLSICQTFLRAMGSELTVSSAPGRGSTFQFDLDLAPVRHE